MDNMEIFACQHFKENQKQGKIISKGTINYMDGHQEDFHSTADAAGAAATNSSKVDPSYKSKRYRDKLRTEVKALENLLPVDRSTLHRKLDSQTVFRLVIAYFRTKMFLEAASSNKLQYVDEARKEREQGSHNRNISSLIGSSHLLQALEGFLLVVTADGTILYVSRNINQSLGFNQVDLMHRCMYGIVHPDDHHELKMVLETSLLESAVPLTNQKSCCLRNSSTAAPCKSISFLVRIKCFNGTTTGYLKMQCSGHMRTFPGVIPSSRTSNQVIFAFCRPFTTTSADGSNGTKMAAGFWSKHGLDLRFRHLDTKTSQVIGYHIDDIEGKSFYSYVHPEDLAVFSTCHKALIHTEDIQTMYFRMQTKEGEWLWLHTRGKVVFKNSKKYSIVFTHCPVREEDSTYIQQEAVVRRRHIVHDVTSGPKNQSPLLLQNDALGYPSSKEHFRYHSYSVSSHSVGTTCPSTWHSKSECHSPVFPSTSLPHRYNARGDEQQQWEQQHLQAPPAKKPRLSDNNSKGPVASSPRPPPSSVGPTMQNPGSQSCSPQEKRLQSQWQQAMHNNAIYNPNDGFNMGTSGDVRNLFPQHNPQGKNSRLAYNQVAPPHATQTPQTRYLMQVNGIGVAGENPNSPTTLFFQGQFTAFTEPTSTFPTAIRHNPCYANQTQQGDALDPRWDIYNSPCYNLHQGQTKNGSSHGLSSLWDVQESQQSLAKNAGVGRQELILDFEDVCDSLVEPTAELSQAQQQAGHSPKNKTLKQERPIVPSDHKDSMLEGKTDSMTMHCRLHRGKPRKSTKPTDPFLAGIKDKISQIDPQTSKKDEDKVILAPCLYDGLFSQRANSVADSVRLDSSSPLQLFGMRIKEEKGGYQNKDQQATHADLPAIGSFLEYLKDISG